MRNETVNKSKEIALSTIQTLGGVVVTSTGMFYIGEVHRISDEVVLAGTVLTGLVVGARGLDRFFRSTNILGINLDDESPQTPENT